MSRRQKRQRRSVKVFGSRKVFVSVVALVTVSTITGWQSIGAVASRSSHVTSRTSSTGGTLWGWGYNAVGQIGDGSLAITAVPKRVLRVSHVTAVAGNGDNGFALESNGTVWAWGLGSQGELGNGTFSALSRAPVPVKGLTDVTAIAGSGGGSTGSGYALEGNGMVFAWGYGIAGALGNGTDTDSDVPVEITSLTNVIAIAGGGPIGGTGYALESNGTVWAWGVGADGELGNGARLNSSVPVQVRGITNAVSIAAGELGGYAVLKTGRVMAWGEARYGSFQNGSALGNGSYATTTVPVFVSKITGITDVAAGGDSAYAVTSSGRVWAWGGSNLGNGTQNGARVPVLLTRITGVKAVGTDISAGFALKTNGTVWAWGSSYYGEVGNGVTSGHFFQWPVQIHGLSHVIGIAVSAPFAIVG